MEITFESSRAHNPTYHALLTDFNPNAFSVSLSHPQQQVMERKDTTDAERQFWTHNGVLEEKDWSDAERCVGFVLAWKSSIVWGVGRVYGPPAATAAAAAAWVVSHPPNPPPGQTKRPKHTRNYWAHFETMQSGENNLEFQHWSNYGVWQEEYKSLTPEEQKKFTDWRYFWAYVSLSLCVFLFVPLGGRVCVDVGIKVSTSVAYPPTPHTTTASTATA